MDQNTAAVLIVLILVAGAVLWELVQHLDDAPAPPGPPVIPPGMWQSRTTTRRTTTRTTPQRAEPTDQP